MSPNINPEHVITLQGQQYCTYRGVLECAHSIGLEGIRTRIVQVPGADNEYVAIVEAEVRLKDGRVFVDVADASPRNVNQRLSSALIRLASTRAKGRALRDAVNIGEALAEELADAEPEHAAPQASRPAPASSPRPAPAPRAAAPPPSGDGDRQPAPAAPARSAAPPPSGDGDRQPAPAPARSVASPPSGDSDRQPAPAVAAAPAAPEPDAAPAPVPEEKPAVPAAREAAPAAGETRAGEMLCSSPGCGRTVTQGQYNYSVQTYGAALCPACQRKRKAQERTS